VRVIVKLFVPVQDAAAVRTRAHDVIHRVAGLPESAADDLLRQVF
jgi:hypothetical protein